LVWAPVRIPFSTIVADIPQGWFRRFVLFSNYFLLLQIQNFF